MSDAELQRMVCGTEARLEPDTPVTVSPPTSTLLPRNHPRKKTSLPSFAPGKGRKLHGASQFPPHLASSCRFFCPHQFGKNAKSWSRCTQPPWSVNWIYGYQPYFSPFSASQIQEYHATCERKDKQENRLTMESQPEAE